MRTSLKSWGTIKEIIRNAWFPGEIGDFCPFCPRWFGLFSFCKVCFLTKKTPQSLKLNICPIQSSQWVGISVSPCSYSCTHRAWRCHRLLSTKDCTLTLHHQFLPLRTCSVWNIPRSSVLCRRSGKDSPCVKLKSFVQFSVVVRANQLPVQRFTQWHIAVFLCMNRTSASQGFLTAELGGTVGTFYVVLMSCNFPWIFLGIMAFSLLQSTVLDLHSGMQRSVQYRALTRVTKS